MYNSISSFYKSEEWQNFRQRLMLERGMICEHCGKLILKKYDAIGHHKTELNMLNVNDPNISLNMDNVMLVHRSCHDEIHSRFGTYTRHVYIVYGSPLSGKTTYVNSVATKNDLVIDLDKIKQCVSGAKLYEQTNRLNDNVFTVRDLLIDMVRTRRGKWINAYIIGGYPYKGERERLANELGAEFIYIESNKEECLLRLEASNDGRDKLLWTKFIEDWFSKIS